MRRPKALMIAKAYYSYVERAATKQMQCIRARLGYLVETLGDGL